MTYKFQRGAAVLSGSILAEEGLDAGTAGVSDAGAIAGATSIDGSGDLTMATITMTGFTVDADGDTALKSLTVDDGSTIGSDSVADLITLAADGNITIKDGGFDFNIAAHDGTNGLKLGGTTVTSTAAELNYLDGAVTTNNANAVKAVLIDASNDLTLANDLTVTNALTVSNSDLVVSTGNISGAGNLQLGGNITIAGDLTVNGTETILNTTILEVEDSNILVASGSDITALGASADGFGISIGSSNQVTLQLADGAGTLKLASSVPVSASTYYGSGANLSGISADAASGFNITPYNTDDYASSSFPGEIISTAGNKGVHAWTNANVTASYTFDLSGSYAAGNVVIIKGHGDTSTYPITIRPNDNSTNSIDGDSSIILESDFASVTMVYDGSGNWMVI